ncbi:hypothetical protein LSAT2_022141 [Lamellibrachia satsuma]|nr:hypothetical protein LSAT2_022141 [Lamellibrachia satsuma]
MLSEKRSIPKDFTVKGPRELNGMTICVRIGSVLPSPLSIEQLPSPLHLAQRKQPLPAMQHLSMQPGWNKGVPPQPSMSQYYDPYNYHTATSQQSLVSGLSMYSCGLVTPSTSYNAMSPSPPYNTSLAPPMQHRQSVSKENPLKDVPFELDNILVELEKAHKISVPTVSYRSNVDLDNEYSYSFSQEEAAVGRVLPNWYSQQQPD